MVPPARSANSKQGSKMAQSPARKSGHASPTRLRILRIAAQLFAERGFSGIGVNEIGEAAALGRGALYYHISSKEDLLYDIMTEYMGSLLLDGRAIAAAEPDPVLRVTKLSRALMGTIGEHLSELTVCFRELHALTAERRTAVARLHADYQALWADVIADGVKAGTFRNTSIIVQKGLLGMFFYSFLWIDPNGRQSPEDIGATFADIVLRALRPDEGLTAPRQPESFQP
jgi:AcrR family transcriptional regulator